MKTNEHTVTAKTTEKVVFHFHFPEEALKRIDPLEIIKQYQKLLESPAKIFLESAP